MRLIRVDDYPYPYDRDRRGFREAIEILEFYGMDYILGASPLLFEDGDIEELNNLISTGRVVMHGFNHAFDFAPWSNITSIWPIGGEFYNLNYENIKDKYNICDKIMTNIVKYDRQHFIPPFNCYTQAMLDVLNDTEVRYIHTCDVEYYNYGYDKLNHHSMIPIISEFQKTYHDAREVVNNLENKTQITLHWICDRNLPNWQASYIELCKKILNEQT